MLAELDDVFGETAAQMARRKALDGLREAARFVIQAKPGPDNDRAAEALLAARAAILDLDASSPARVTEWVSEGD